jgi:hypothetical protein
MQLSNRRLTFALLAAWSLCNSSRAADVCTLPEICLPATLEFACASAWEPATVTRNLQIKQPYSAQYIEDQVAEGLSSVDAYRLSRGQMRGGEISMIKWRIIWGKESAELVHTATIEETAVLLECAKSKPTLHLQRSAWVSGFQDQVAADHTTTPEVRARRKKDRFDLSKGKLSSPVLKASDSRIDPVKPDAIERKFEFIRRDFPTGVSHGDARNYFDSSFDEFLRFDSPVSFTLWTNVEGTELLFLNPKGELLVRLRRMLSPHRYTDARNRFTNSVTQELQAAQAYLKGLEGTHDSRRLPLMEPDTYATYKSLAESLRSALTHPSPEAVAALNEQLKGNVWPEVSKDIPLVEVGAWVKGFVDHVEAAYRVSRP